MRQIDINPLLEGVKSAQESIPVVDCSIEQHLWGKTITMGIYIYTRGKNVMWMVHLYGSRGTSCPFKCFQSRDNRVDFLRTQAMIVAIEQGKTCNGTSKRQKVFTHQGTQTSLDAIQAGQSGLICTPRCDNNIIPSYALRYRPVCERRSIRALVHFLVTKRSKSTKIRNSMHTRESDSALASRTKTRYVGYNRHVTLPYRSRVWI